MALLERPTRGRIEGGHSEENRRYRRIRTGVAEGDDPIPGDDLGELGCKARTERLELRPRISEVRRSVVAM